MTSTETRITFETLPQAVEEIKAEVVDLRMRIEELLENGSDNSQNYWMDINQLRSHHLVHPAKSGCIRIAYLFIRMVRSCVSLSLRLMSG